MTDEQWQVAWKLYQSGSSVPSERFHSFLNGAGDLQVRDAVLGMLSGNKSVEGLDRVGQKIGRYVLTGRLGQGGMGEVFSARDLELGRPVAIKFLSSQPADRATPVERFIREAKAASALNHPNIVTIYEVIHSQSRLAIVMELVDGIMLRRLCGTPMPVDRVLHLGGQVARALGAAHARGIVHYDIKPENLIVRPDGLVKVLDFGLARDLTSIGSSSILPAGTLRYMSPEQSGGESPSGASDIFSLGIVLYELAAGAHPFESGSIFETLEALNQAEPPAPSTLNAFLPAELDALILEMLAKDPSLRPAAGEVAQMLETGIRGESTRAPGRSSSRRGSSFKKKTAGKSGSTLVFGGLRWKVATGLLAAGSAVVLWAPWNSTVRPIVQSSIAQPSMRLDLDLGPDVSLGPTIGPAVILSPDGTRLVFVSQGQDETPRLFTRKLDQPRATPLAKTEHAYAPFFSPDGQWVGFFADGMLKKTRIDGGEPVSLCEANSGRGATWAEDGNIIAELDAQAGLSQVPQEGGSAVPVTTLNVELGESTHRWPQVLPGGKAVLFNVNAAQANWDESRIAVVSRKNGQTKTLLDHAGMYPRYLPSGHLVYTSKGTLFAVPFDLDRLEVRGPAKRLEAVSSHRGLGAAQVDFSRNGTFVYRSGGPEGLRTIQWLDGSGKAVSLGFEPAIYLVPRLSPDGNQLAYVVSQGSNMDLWVYDFQHGIKTRVATGQNFYPVWSPDGRFLVFQTPRGMFWAPANGAGQPQPLMQQQKSLRYPTSFTPDGTRLIFSEQIPGGGAEIRTVPVHLKSGQLLAGEPQSFLKTPGVLSFASISPDGRWVAYADAEGGSYEVCVRAFPDNGTKVQVSTAGGTMPVWSRTRNELFYRSDQRIMVANYTIKGDSFAADKPRVWFGKQLAGVGLGVNFDLAPDGKRLIVLTPAEAPESRDARSHVTVVVNYFDEVRRRMAGHRD